MITHSDAAKIIALVTACHPRTAPRLDDRDVARATAETWADLFNVHRLDLADLLAAVKKRATSEADAPAPAEIITVARGIRQARDADTGPTPAYEALCESKAEDADELAERRRLRELAPAAERPKIRELVAEIAAAKALAMAEIRQTAPRAIDHASPVPSRQTARPQAGDAPPARQNDAPEASA